MINSIAKNNVEFIGVLGFLGVWELAARVFFNHTNIFPSPTQSLVEAWNFLTPLDLLEHVSLSLFRISSGFLIATVLGILLGLACSFTLWLSILLRPVIEFLRPIPPLAWIPIAIIWFGLGEPSKIFVISLGAFFPIFTNVYRGVIMVPKVLIQAARTMDVNGSRLLWRVVLPAALPDLVTGLRVALGLSFGVLVAAELIAAERGLGYLIMEARQIGHIGVSIFGILIIGLLTMAVDWQVGRFISLTVGRWTRI